MILSNSQKVIVLDDKYEEAEPLIKSLAKVGIPTIYCDGDVENIPSSPLLGVRIVFSDLRFSAVSDPRSVSTFLITLLKNLISIDNGPYILFIWSKHDNEYLEDVKKELSETNEIAKPYMIINMEKSGFIRVIPKENEVYKQIASVVTSDKEKDVNSELIEIIKNNIGQDDETVEVIEGGLEKLQAYLQKKLNEVNSLSILLMWEKIVNNASRNLVNSIAELSEPSDEWDNNIKVLIQNLAYANAGKSIEKTSKSYIINAISALNQMLPDELWNSLMKEDINEQRFSFIEEASIKKNVDKYTYSISKPAKKYIVKKNNTDYKTFKNIDEIEDDVTDKEVINELYDKYLEFTGKSNFKLLCQRCDEGSILKKPGGIYEVDDNEMLEKVSRSILKNNDMTNYKDIKLIKLDISSACDYAQNKLERVRIIYGIMIGEEHFNNINNFQDIYCTPQLNIENKNVKIALNYNYITNEAELNYENCIFLFRELLLIEIKHKLQSYITRVGIINI